MREQTYEIAIARDFRPGTQELSYAAVTGHPYLESQGCSLALYNRAGSGRILTIVDYFFRDLSTANSTSQTQFFMQPVTSWTLGGAEDKLSGYLGKLDKNNGGLPSQVHFYESPESVGVAQGVLRVIPNMIFFNELRAMQNMSSWLYGDSRSGVAFASLFHKDKNSQVQGIIIRAGEGLAISPTGGQVNQTIKYNLSFWIQDTSNNACYFCNIPIAPDGGRVAALFINDSGSGKTYEVYDVYWSEVGNDTQPDQYSLEQIEYLEPNSGILLDIYSHDSTNESLIGKIDYRRECSTTIAGQSKGALIATPRLGRGIPINQGAAPFLSGSLPLPFHAFNQNLFNVRNEKYVIVLREGEGIGFFKRVMSSRGRAGIFIRFTVRKAPRGYSRSRVVNQNI